MTAPPDTRSPLDTRSILGPTGLIAGRLSGYEARPQQLEMAEAVAGAIRNRRHLMVEADTGVGKSFAYLVPAILASAHEGKTIVIATQTISLQEQLIAKDIPFLQRVMPQKFTAALAKGRGNFISLRRLAAASRKPMDFFPNPEDAAHLVQIGHWAKKTSDGSQSDLDFTPRPTVWNEVASDADHCRGKDCPMHDQCFYYTARSRLETANILIVNHALYMTDLALRRSGASFLPDHEVVIFDEAHHLEAVASRHLGQTISEGQILSHLKRVQHPQTGQGVLSRAGLAPDWTKRASAHAEQTRQATSAFFEQVAALMDGQPTLRLHRGPLLSTCDPLTSALASLAAVIREGHLETTVRASTIKKASKRKRDLLDTAKELEAAHKRCESLAAGIQGWMGQKEADGVYWLEATGLGSGGRRSIALSSAPLDVTPTLRAVLFDRVPTCILTSATLAVGTPPRFDYCGKRLGLDESRCDTLQLGGPFDYPRQVKIYFPRHMPDPSHRPKSGEFERQAIRALPHYIEKTKGNAFVLFTSYKMLGDAAQELAPWLERQGYPLLVQGGPMPPSKMIATFKATPNSVLFGTDSFWQGVDVPGESLTSVIITRLPFRMPDHPLLEARLDHIQQRGGNPFVEYQVPEAVIRLKQGFGRLIRSQTDSGIVVILDPRVLTKPYGRIFLDSLPRCPTIVEPVRDPESIPTRSSPTADSGSDGATP